MNISFSQAQITSSDWQLDRAVRLTTQSSMFEKYPEAYLTADIAIPNFEQKMSNAEQEILLPRPDGTFSTYIIKPSQVVAKEVAHLYTIKTFIGYQKDAPSVLVACDISNQGFHAAVYDGMQSYFIEPLEFAAAQHIVYYKKDLLTSKVKCLVEETIGTKLPPANKIFAPNVKRTYRLAIVSMGEYSQQFGGSPYNSTNVLNAMASGVNMMAPIWLRDLGVEFNLVSTAALVFPNPNTDPFNINNQNALLPACHNECVSALGNGGFDIGHIIAWDDAGGLASFEVTCSNSDKGEGFSGAAGSVSQLWVDYVSHEIGHQFGSEHNFVAGCSGNSAAGHRYEPGEGSSIMSYAGVCNNADSYQSFSDPYFHYNSIQQMQAHMNTTSCPTTSSAGNGSDPVANAQGNITIPKQTPFILVGIGSDNNDPTSALTYDWVQYDGNSPVASGNPNCNSTTAPLFRYRPPTSNNYRHFPQYTDVIAGNNNSITWEKLPCVARSMNFSMAVRDNNSNFGRVVHDEMTVTVANTGPFNITAPNGGESLNGSTTVTWTVNGTDSHCANVDLLLSTDGGASYSVLVNATPNDGSQNVTLPNSSSNARMLIRCDVAGGFRSASTFYDVSNANFTISGGGNATCNDGIQNQGETGIDCGGPCPACAPTCSDGIQNQGETGIDCGGPCAPCATCETYTLVIVTDDYPEDTSWEINDPTGATVASGGNYNNPGATETATFCLTEGICYTFVIFDEFGDGICCTEGNGSYTITDASNMVVASGGNFTNQESSQICPSSSNGNCFTDLTNSNGLSTNETGVKDYESSTFIMTTATTVLQSGSSVDYDAITTVELNSGFEVKLGAVFEAFIDGCDNGGGGSN